MRFLFGVQFASGQPDSPLRLCEAMARAALPRRKAVLLAPPRSPVGFGICSLAGENPGAQAAVVHDERASVLLAADVRLDAPRDLARALDADPASPHESLLLSAWERWHEGCLERISGLFAFALWDGMRRTLVLARDPSGEKPLFFTRSQDSIAFASMPRPLLAMAGAHERIDEERLAEFLCGYPARQGHTLFAGIERLPRGSFLLATPERVEVRPFWTPNHAPRIRYRRDADYIDDFRERFGRSVAACLQGTETVGSQLSSGLDSSSVTAIAAAQMAAQGKKLVALTAVPLPALPPLTWPGRFADEGPPAAQALAGFPNVEHVLLDGGGRDIVAALDQVARAFEEPAYNVINHLWTGRMLEECRRRGIDVLLCGSGGNGTISFDGLAYLHELFRSFRWLRLFGLVRRLRINGYISGRGALRWAVGAAIPAALRRLWPGSQGDFALGYSPLRPEIDRRYRLRERLFEQSYRREVSVRAMLRDYYEIYDAGAVNVATALDCGVEYRDPTQDRRILEFCFGIPPEQFLAGGRTRSLVRRAMVGLLPPSTLYRTLRGIQSADWYLLMRPQLARLRAELDRIGHSPLAQRLLDLPRLRQLLDTWPAGRWEDVAITDSYHLALTRGLAAGRFLTLHDPDFQAEHATPAAAVLQR